MASHIRSRVLPALASGRVLLACLVLLLAACAGVSGDRDGKPDWVTGTSSEYPQGQYITGYGQAPNLEVAQDRARANIAKVFEVDIVEHSEDIQAQEQRTDGETQQDHSESRITRQISTETRQIISGIEIADVWQPPEGGAYYVLAVLSRQQADTRLKRQIRTLDQDTERAIARARNSDDALVSVRYAAEALDAQQERAAFQKIASIIDPSGRGIPPRWDVSRLRNDLDDLLDRLHIEISSNGNDAETLKPLLTAAVTAAGMQVVDNGQGDYVLVGSLDITDLGFRDGWYWQRAAVDIRLRDKADDRLRGTKTWNALKTAALDPALARKRLLDKLETTLKTELRPAILTMAAP